MIYLYGAGAYGIHMYYVLKQYGISVDGFIDQDERKKGYFFDGVSCITLENLKTALSKDEIIVIVCIKKKEDYIIETLRMCTIERVYTMKQYANKYLSKCTFEKRIPLRNSSALRSEKERFSELYYHDILNPILDPTLIDISQDAFTRRIKCEDSGN